MGSPWYKIMLGMSYYIHAGGLGALKALPGSVSKRVTPVAVIVLSLLFWMKIPYNTSIIPRVGVLYLEDP